MDIESKIDELQKLVSKYDTESFAGFFAYFIKRRPDTAADIVINKFESKLKDFLYLIALNVFSEQKGTLKFEFPNSDLGIFADKLNDLKRFTNSDENFDYTLESIIHELAVRNHFDNGTLSYVEQDLEKIRRIFTPFENKITQDFGFDIHFLIEIFKEIELISMIRVKKSMGFMQTKEFADFIISTQDKKLKFSEAFDLLPKDIQDDFHSFDAKTYSHLMFTSDDLYHRLDKEKVDKFLSLFSISSVSDKSVRYYTAESPFELTPLLQLENGHYLSLYGKQIPISIYKVIYKYLFNDIKYNSKIRKHRENNLEYKVSELFKNFFPRKKTIYFENYSIEKNVEQDLMIIYNGTVIIVEIKASKLREPFRDTEKAIVRLKEDFKNSVQYGFEQCKRVEDYFFDNKQFDIRNEKGKKLYTINPNKIHSVFSIVITLERFGSLQTDLSLLLQKEENIDYPWSVYIDDLEIFLLTLKQNIKNPTSEFLNFLKLRREIYGRTEAIDELDICATYLQNPKKFKNYTESENQFLLFSPLAQNDFDKLYYANKLKFKENALPDDFYRFGLE